MLTRGRDHVCVLADERRVALVEQLAEEARENGPVSGESIRLIIEGASHCKPFMGE